jgi:hypothetical protein
MKAFDTTPLMRGLSGVDGLGAMGTSKAADLHASFEVAASIAVLSVRRLRRRTTLFGGNKMVSKTMGAWGSFLFLSNLITGALLGLFFAGRFCAYRFARCRAAHAHGASAPRRRRAPYAAACAPRAQPRAVAPAHAPRTHRLRSSQIPRNHRPAVV